VRPRISVVIPTHNHSRVVPRTLNALGRQTLPSGEFEVLLVLDGCSDDTARVVGALDVPYELHPVEQPPSGAAAARNRGAAMAKAPILLFLDDDMEASPDLLAAHLEIHEAHPGGVVLGYFPLEVPEGDPDPYTLAIKSWWDRAFVALAHPAHRFTFLDFCTGNVSLPRAVFEAVGRFDESFPGASTEDYEIGARLLKRRVPMRFSREAASLHCDAPTRERSLRRAAADGRGQVLLARRHPELASLLKLGEPPGSTSSRLYWHLVWKSPTAATLLAAVFRRLLGACVKLGWTGLMWRFYGGLDVHAYWSAVRGEVGALEDWRRLVDSASRSRTDVRELEVDLAEGFGRLESLLAATPVDGLKLRYRESVLGEIEPLPAAEPLRYAHVRFELIQRFGSELLPLLLVDWLGSRSAGELAETIAAADTR